MKPTRPIESNDIVRIKKEIPEKTGVVNRVEGESVNIFITDGPSDIGIWFNIREIKRIGRIKRCAL